MANGENTRGKENKQMCRLKTDPAVVLCLFLVLGVARVFLELVTDNTA